MGRVALRGGDAGFRRCEGRTKMEPSQCGGRRQKTLEEVLLRSQGMRVNAQEV